MCVTFSRSVFRGVSGLLWGWNGLGVVQSRLVSTGCLVIYVVINTSNDLLKKTKTNEESVTLDTAMERKQKKAAKV